MMAFLLDIITFLQISFSTNIFFYKYLFLQISFGLTIPDVNISDYFSRSLKDAGINSKSETTIIIKSGDNSPVVEGVAIDQDIEISSLKALIAATNKLYI
ncbi:alpha-isopropylmalate synthase regulatory domain-containing protein [Francisella tularensis]|uniref:alpha-isopropylmalate synthase regulatory domain-containing protein n=2 Tax=Francisella tularensis TaxID=263 RepID=UPI001F40DA2D|nr:alpha-isopropylmalate synthase regulatory domain-containing protein [Francisella tularensis]